MSHGIQNDSSATHTDCVERLFLLAYAHQIETAPTILEAREGEVVLLALPAGQRLENCLLALVDIGFIISFVQLEGTTSATGESVYVILRSRPTATPAGGTAEIGCAPAD